MKFFVVYLVIFVISYLYGNGMVILSLDWFSAHVLLNYVTSTWPSAWNPCRRVMTNEVGLLCWQMHIRDQVTFILSKKIRVHLNLARFLQWKITLILARSRVPDKNLTTIAAFWRVSQSHYFQVSSGRGVFAGVTTFPSESYMMTPEKSGSWHFPPMSMFFCQTGTPCCSQLSMLSSPLLSWYSWNVVACCTTTSLLSSMTGSSSRKS